MKRIILIAIASCALLPVAGQTMHDYNFISQTNPWLKSNNAAGLVTFDKPHISVAEIDLEKKDGAYMGIEDSDNSIKGALSTESYTKISDRINAFGRLSYSYFYGKNMGGPIFIDPSYNPFSLIEANPETTGIKTREFYTLDGGLSYKLSDSWALGSYINYTSAISAKRKDPRFRNILMDLDLSLGARYQPSPRTSLGASLIYQRVLEKMDGSKYGDLALDYYNYIDYGGFLCKREVFAGDYGYVPEGNTRNMFNSLYGIALQFQAKNKRIDSFNEIKALYRDGYYGNKGSSNIIYSEHNSLIFAYSGALIVHNQDNVQKFGIELECELLSNAEKVYRINTQPGKQTVIEYFGNKDILDRTELKESLYWKGWSGLQTYKAAWEYGAELSANFCSQKVNIYPSFTESQLFTAKFEAQLKRNFQTKNNILSPDLMLGFNIGGGNPKVNGEISSTGLYYADVYLQRDFEYKSIASLGLGAGFTYTKIINSGLDVYCRLSDQYIHCLKEVQSLQGNYRNILLLTIGCTF